MRQSGFAYAALAATTDDPETPDGWPDGWDFPNDVDPPGWGHLVMTQYVDGALNTAVVKAVEPATAKTTRALALTAGDTEVTAATATATTGRSSVHWSYLQTGSGPDTFQVHVSHYRGFYQFTVPAEATKVYVVAQGIGENYYGYPSGAKTVNAAWNHTCYLSTTSPGTLAAASWAYGALGATVAAQTHVGQDDTAGEAIELTFGGESLTAGETYYMQHRMDEVKPTALATVTWPSGVDWDHYWKRIFDGTYGAVTTLVYQV